MRSVLRFFSFFNSPSFLIIQYSTVGIYGDADPLDVAQWDAMTYSVPSDTRTWNEITSTCSNMFNGA
jgi:hypothetical protein